jgi:hypothetical protein
MFDAHTAQGIFALTQLKDWSVQIASEMVWHNTRGRKATTRYARKDMAIGGR